MCACACVCMFLQPVTLRLFKTQLTKMCLSFPGQFERFRRIFYTKCFSTLLNHTDHRLISSLEVSEDVWKARVFVENGYRKEEAVYEFTMVRRFGGRYDGVWFCDQLICDGCDDRHLYGVI